MNIDNPEVSIDILDIKHFASVRRFASNIDIGNHIAERGFNDNFLNSSIAEEHFAICVNIIDSIFHFTESHLPHRHLGSHLPHLGAHRLQQRLLH